MSAHSLCQIHGKNADSNETLMPKKKAISLVWDHFGLHIDREGRVIDSDVAVCHRCRSNVRWEHL